MRALPLLLSLLVIGSGCAKTLDDPTPYVDAPRVLAVSIDPPEGPTGAETRFTALYADATGALTTGPLAFDYCLAQKPLAELGPVARTCFDPASQKLVPIAAVPPEASPSDPASGLEAKGPIPIESCRLFGPDSPPSTGGGPGGRPVDPDATGGYYQPVVVFTTDGSSSPTLAQVRLSCGLANVTPDVAEAYARSYVRNRNPGIDSVAIARGDSLVPLSPDGTGTPAVVAPGEQVRIVVAWADAAETYVVYDRGSQTLVPRREALSVTYFASEGRFENARTGRAGSDLETSTTNGFTAPSEPGDVYLAVVLRDERGGVTFGSYRIRVQP